MDWVCEYCATANKKRHCKCFVCKQKRVSKPTEQKCRRRSSVDSSFVFKIIEYVIKGIYVLVAGAGVTILTIFFVQTLLKNPISSVIDVWECIWKDCSDSVKTAFSYCINGAKDLFGKITALF